MSNVFLITADTNTHASTHMHAHTHTHSHIFTHPYTRSNGVVPFEDHEPTGLKAEPADLHDDSTALSATHSKQTHAHAHTTGKSVLK